MTSTQVNEIRAGLDKLQEVLDTLRVQFEYAMLRPDAGPIQLELPLGDEHALPR